jgi:diguanylate cyclase (GGDEF)-like protein
MDSGEEVSLDRLHKLENTQPYEEFSVYHDISESIGEGKSLYFRSKNIFYSVYVDGVNVYDPYVPESIFYTDSFGTRWNCIPILQSYAGKQIEIRITRVYETSRASIDNIYLGDSGGMILHTISGRLSAFVTCILLLFVGIMLIIADIPINVQIQKNHELMYLGLFALTVSMWCFSETNLIQFYFYDSRAIQLLSCMSLMLIPIPAFLYSDAACGFKRKWVTPLLCLMSVINIVLCWTLHLLKIKDIHDTLIITHVMLGLSAFALFYSIIKEAIGKWRKKIMNGYRILETVGFCAICFATIIDIYRYYKGYSDDSAMFVRIGLLLFVICYGCASLENTVNAVKKGAQTELVRQLAYHDGLTGIGNRTAFKEKLEELDKQRYESSNIGVVMFDVNDLKFVNDNFGHAIGDKMITKSADVIKNAFEPYQGSCFRIGGDEFAVLLSGEGVDDRYHKAIADFRRGIDEHNSDKNKEFYLSIAHGYAEYNRTVVESQNLASVYRQADENMYKNKKEMKAKHNPKDLYAEVINKNK